MATPSAVVVSSAVFCGFSSGLFSFLATNAPTASIRPWPVAVSPFTLKVPDMPLMVVATMAFAPKLPSLSVSVTRYHPSASEPMVAVSPSPSVLPSEAACPADIAAANARNHASSPSSVLVAAYAAGLSLYSVGVVAGGVIVALAVSTALFTAVIHSSSVSTCTASPATVSVANLYAE